MNRWSGRRSIRRPGGDDVSATCRAGVPPASDCRTRHLLYATASAPRRAARPARMPAWAPGATRSRPSRGERARPPASPVSRAYKKAPEVTRQAHVILENQGARARRPRTRSIPWTGQGEGGGAGSGALLTLDQLQRSGREQQKHWMIRGAVAAFVGGRGRCPAAAH